MVKSGIVYPFGMGFWGANGHDGIWHIALIESLAKGSFKMPVFGGMTLQNYHVGFDLILAIIHKLTNIPVVNLYFQVFPPIAAMLIGLFTYKFVYLWTKSKAASFWSTFFVYFGGSFAWIFGRGESAFWSQEAISTLINPPFALSLVFMLLGMIFLIKEKKRWRDYVLMVVIFGILIEIKSYGGLLSLGGLFVASIYSIVKSRKWDLFCVFVSSLVLSIILYLPLNSKSAGLILWQPFWFLESMVAASDRFPWPKMAQAMLAYKDTHVIFKFIGSYLTVFAIFVVGNLGSRIVFIFRRLKSIEDIDIFIYSIFFAGILIPTFFLQKGTPWNTIQFIYYSLFLSSILVGIAMRDIFARLGARSYLPFSIIVIGITVPTTFLSLRDIYLPSTPPAMLSNDELSALTFLKNQPDGIILTYPLETFWQGSG